MSTSSKKTKRPKGIAKPARDSELRAAAKTVSATMPTKALAFQVKTIADPLTHQDIAIISYLHTLGDPWVDDPAGVPLMAGGTLMRRTVKAQIKFEIQAIANASGFASATLNCDGWVGSEASVGTANKYASYNVASQGFPLWYTNALYVGTTLPSSIGTTATPGLLATPMPFLDGQITSTSNVRMVAAGMRAFSDSSINTAQGKIAMVATSRPFGTPAQGALTASSYATLSTLPTDVVSFQAVPCAGWKSGSSLYAVAIPSDPNCFTFFNPPAIGSQVFGFPQLGAILTGGAANQSMTVQVVMDYEFDIGVSNLTGIDADPIVSVSPSDLVPHISQMHAGKVGSGKANMGLGAQAFLQQTAVTRPLKLASAIQQASNPGLLSGIGGAAKAALGWIADKGLGYVKNFVRGIPAVNAVMTSLGL